MKIRPKEIPIYLTGGVSGVGRTSNDWYNNVHIYLKLAILDRLKKYGEADDYMYWLNAMLSEHSKIYNSEKNRMNRPLYSDSVKNYLRAYSGNSDSYPGASLETGDNDDYNQYGIKKSFENGIFTYPGKRTSGDNPDIGYNPDGYFSGITDYRRLLGRQEDWDPNSLQFKNWQKELNNIGYETYLDTNDGYYKLRRLPKDTNLNNPPSQTTELNPDDTAQGVQPQTQTRSLEELNSAKPLLRSLTGGINVSPKADLESKWKIFGDRLKAAAPDIIDALRLAGNLHNNNRVYDAALKGIRPNLQQTYNTYRQVVGDEATKLAYYRRGIAGLTKAGLAFTSDSDRQMAYLMEAKRAADELKAQGDLADNAEIRRTSDESNQHQWANIQRATEVANRNLIEMNNANAAKWNLKALKYSADWTNWDNYLMGIQSRMTLKKEEEEAFKRLLALLDIQDDYINDDWLQSLELQRQNLYTLYLSITGTDEESKAKKESLQNQILLKNKEINSRKLQLQKDSLRKMYPEYAKSGTKIEYKATDKYLYKTSKDLVEHFRKMSKMADDSRLKSRTKPIKLSSHPKGNTRKYLLGGVAPFTVFRPLGIGGESAIGSQTTSSGSSKSSNSSSSGKDDAAKNKLDLVKELFKSLKGLPVDVNVAYKDIYSLFEKSKLFGEELSTDDIAGIYLNSMRAVSLLLYGQEAYEKAKALATSNEALNEYAVTADGSYVVSDKDGNLSYKKNLKEIEESGLVPITNLQLINMRAYSPNMVGLRGDTIIENVIGNGMGINKIGAQIKALAGNIGATEGKLEGISQVESGKVKAGLLILAGTAGTPDGHYSVTTYTKDLLSLIQAALRYINNMLSPSLKATLEAHGGVELNIMLFLGSQLEYTKELAISPLTGKAAKDANGNSKSGSGTDTPASVLFLLGNGYSEIVEFNIGNSQSVKALGRFGILLDKEKNNLGLGSNFLDVSKSLFGPILDMDKATFGGARLNSNGYSHIILNNSDCIGLDLPVKRDLSGNYVPDFLLLSLIEKAEEQIHNNRITDPKLINKIYKDLGLPEKFDSNGNIILQNYRRFAGILVILDSKALKGGTPINVNEISEADDTERELFIEAMKKENKDYDLSDGFLWSNWGRDKLYKGTIFIPVREDIVSGYISGGYPLDTDLPNNANKVAIMLYAPKTLLYQKTPPLSSLK